VLRVLAHLITRTDRPRRSEVVDAVVEYVPGAVAVGYLANPDFEIPLPGPDFADHIGIILACRVRTSTSHRRRTVTATARDTAQAPTPARTHPGGCACGGGGRTRSPVIGQRSRSTEDRPGALYDPPSPRLVSALVQSVAMGFLGCGEGDFVVADGGVEGGFDLVLSWSRTSTATSCGPPLPPHVIRRTARCRVGGK
jgi:hypothetical protein